MESKKSQLGRGTAKGGRLVKKDGETAHLRGREGSGARRA